MIVILLGVIAACLLIQVGAGTAPARAQVAAGPDAPPAAGEGVIVVGGQVTPETYGLYLIDLKNGTISVYQYVSSLRKLRLMAARNFTFDAQLDEYNTEPPPREIKTLVRQQQRLSDAK